MSEKQQIIHYWKLAKLVRSSEAKIAFFDENEEAFYLDVPQGEEFENCKYSFCEEKALTPEEAEDLQDNSWASFPNEFKVYAFDYCISGGVAYEAIDSPVTIDQIVSLVSIETLNEKIEDQGLMLSEAEDDVMLILEKKLKKLGISATEDDLCDATKKLLQDLRDYQDDNHPDNIKVA